MRRYVFIAVLVSLASQAAEAGHMGFGGLGFGGFGFGGHHGGFHGLGGFGFFATERLQTHFENKFADLMAEYDDGVANVEDFFNSDQYTEIVDDVERLVDRDDLFVAGVERSIDRIDDILMIANDDLDFYEQLLADYQARDDLSEERLMRIEDWITNIQDHLNMKIDRLTDQQATLSDNLGSYQSFNDELAAYLNEIVAAGGGTTDETASVSDVLAASIAEIVAADGATANDSIASNVASLVVASSTSVSAAEPLRLVASPAAVAEPSTLLLLAAAFAGVVSRRQALPASGRNG
jgi:hypothetical protein